MIQLPLSAPFEIVTTRTSRFLFATMPPKRLCTIQSDLGPEANSLVTSISPHALSRLAEDLPGELWSLTWVLEQRPMPSRLCTARAGLKQRRALKLISFERDLGLLRFAQQNAHCFSHFEGYASAVQSILDHGRCKRAESIAASSR